MTKPTGEIPITQPDDLFERVVSILDQARGNVVRAVNTNMVLAYWLIGREIVEALAIRHPAGSESSLQGFSSQLSWSHYRALMRIKNVAVCNLLRMRICAGGLHW